MAWTLAQYNALQDAVALGVKKVKYGDKETEYQSLQEMLDLLDAMQQQLFPPDSLANRRRIGLTQIAAPRRGGWGGWLWTILLILHIIA